MGKHDRVQETGVGSDIKGTESRKTFYWPDAHKGENVIWRLPENMKWNDNVVVREDEYGVFLRDGKALRIFDIPDRYALTTQNISGIQRVADKLMGVIQIGEFYWVQKREFRSNFGTVEPLTYRDNDFGLVRIRAFGQFAYRVFDPMLLITQFVGTKGMTTSDEIVNWLKNQIVMILNDTLGELKSQKGMSILDMPAQLQIIEQLCLGKLTPQTQAYGLKITKFSNINLNLTDEVQAAIDKRGAMSTLGVNYMQYQTGKAVEGVGIGAAQGGDASGFAGLGAGMGAGLSMAQAMMKGMEGQDLTDKSLTCHKCGKQIPETAKFCPECGASTSSTNTTCKKCGGKMPENAKFCPGCGDKQ